MKKGLNILHICLRKIFCICITGMAVITGLNVPATQAHAQLSTYEPSPAYEFAFAYHKLVGSTPAFETIAKNRQAYKDAGEREEPKVLKQITQRLRSRFQEMEARQELLTLRTKLQMKVKRQQQKDKDVLKLRLPENRPLYFPMQPGKRKIAVIMQDFKRFREIPIEPMEANYIESRATSEEDIIMYLQLQPVDADGTKPIRLDGVQQWPLLTRIARMGLYNREKETIWEYKAQWFTTEQGDDVRKLFRK